MKGLWGSLATLRRRLPLPGELGERLACRHVESLGWTVVTRNFRCRSGEVDIVARQPDGATVFIEVKERRDPSHGAAHEAVTSGKRLRVVRAARLYALSHGLWGTPLRFDVIAIEWSEGRPRLRHDRDAFDADGR